MHAKHHRKRSPGLQGHNTPHQSTSQFCVAKEKGGKAGSTTSTPSLCATRPFHLWPIPAWTAACPSSTGSYTDDDIVY